MRMFIGSFGPDIHTVDFDPETISLKYIHRTTVGSAPSWLISGKDQSLLYATDEIGTYDGSGKWEKGSGAVIVFRINASNDKQPLTRVQTVLSGGDGPTHLHFDEDERLVYCANYFGGRFSVFRILRPFDGIFGTLKLEQVLDLNEPGKLELGPKPDRQDVAHAHWLGPDTLSAGKFVYGVDLGQDKIFQYINVGTELRPNPSCEFIRSRPGAGPRHMVFHPTQPWAWVCNELDATMSSYLQDTKTGCLSDERQYLSTIPAGKKPTEIVRPSAIMLDKAAKFLYMTNRGGSNDIVVYKITSDGLLEHVQSVDSNGIFPRHIELSPDEKWIHCTNQDSNRIDMFARDPETGKLEWKCGLDGIELPVFTYFVK